VDLYVEKIDSLLRKNLSIRGFKLWEVIKEKIPDIWSRPTSSTGKYHKKIDEDNRTPSIAEHTYEIMYAADKIVDLLNGCNRDLIFLSIVLHDSFKYGLTGSNPHTENKHDRIIGDTVRDNKGIFLKIFNENEVVLLEEIVRFHSGRWSTDSNIKTFSFNNFNQEVMFLHILDMLSAKNVIKIVEENKCH